MGRRLRGTPDLVVDDEEGGQGGGGAGAGRGRGLGLGLGRVGGVDGLAQNEGGGLGRLGAVCRWDRPPRLGGGHALELQLLLGACRGDLMNHCCLVGGAMRVGGALGRPSLGR